MILVCPSCDTRYFADDTSIGKDGRRVRCATCGHAWFAKLAEEGAPPPAEDTGLTREQVERLRQTAAANSSARAGPHAEFRAREHARRKRERGQATGIAWIAGFVVFAAAAGASILFRNDIAEAFPKVASIYRMVGLDVNRFGLVLENVNAKRSFDGTTPVLTVTGTAINKGDERRETPQLRVTLRDEGGKEVKTWTDNLSVPELGAGEKIDFSSRFEAPPVETYRLTVTFAHKPGEKPEGGETHIQANTSEQPQAPGAVPAPAKAAGANAADPKNTTDSKYEEPGWNGGDGPATGPDGEDAAAVKQAQATPGVTKPTPGQVQTQPSQAQPSQAQPSQAQSGQVKPSPVKPSQPKPGKVEAGHN
jgi:predicted Zn finger-like uncharacterized protein